MEAKKKNPISIIFMVVGVIFVLVAGGIFVTTAWQYLPELAKQLFLLLVAGGMFGGSYLLATRTELSWIETVLYYLGVAFLGYFVLSVMGGLVAHDAGHLPENDVYYDLGNIQRINSFRMLWASVAMLVPVVLRAYIRKSGLDFTSAVVLTDLASIFLGIAFEIKFEEFMIIPAFIVLFLALLNKFNIDNNTENSGLGLAVRINYYFHSLIVLPVIPMLLLAHNAQTSNIAFLAILVTAITFVSYGEKMMFYILLVYDCIIPFAQVLNSLNDNALMYIPFSFAVAGICVLLLLKNKDDEKLSKIAVAEAVIGVATAITVITRNVTGDIELGEFGIGWFGIIAGTFLLVAVLVSHNLAKQVLKTFALVNGLLSGSFFIGYLLEVPEQYLVEANCALIGIAIVLLGYIWYDKEKVCDITQFVLTCITLITLLLHNLDVNEVTNMLILALTALVMLLVSAKKERKDYMIASASTLVIMALYLTKGIWLSISWWVYLFVAGVILIAIAVKKEYVNERN